MYENGAWKKRPVLWLILADAYGMTHVECYRPLLDDFADHPAMSYMWMKNAARGYGALVDHSLSVGSLPEFTKWRKEGVLQRHLLRGLAIALVNGTVDASLGGRTVDATRLYWSPLGKRQATVLLSALTLFINWMKDQPEATAWFAAASTERIERNPQVALAIAKELLIRKRNSLLGHLKGVERRPPHAFPGVVGKSTKGTVAVPTFPAKYVGPLLYKAFRNERDECDETAQLLAHLIVMLGIRKSEGFHLYVSDVQFINQEPWIFFHHPEFGKIQLENSWQITRTEYLQQFGTLPRNRENGRYLAGWKGMADDEQGTPGYFLPIAPLRQRTADLPGSTSSSPGQLSWPGVRAPSVTIHSSW